MAKRIYKVIINTGEVGYFIEEEKLLLPAVREFYSACPSLDTTYEYDDIEIFTSTPVEISGAVLKALATQYAQSECSCYTNDYFGFVRGFIACQSLMTEVSTLESFDY